MNIYRERNARSGQNAGNDNKWIFNPFFYNKYRFFSYFFSLFTAGTKKKWTKKSEGEFL